jgi:xanthine dehydrogenase YagT iron-sulfur-binding subunit
MEQFREIKLSRRDVLIAGAVSASAVAMPGANAQTAANAPAANPEPVKVGVSFNVNGKDVTLELDTRTTLLDALREHLHLTGSKKGCDQGQCGACTIIMDGRRINSCLSLAIMHDGAKITTIEGLGTPDKLHPCGYCTPGQICASVSVIEEIRAGMPSHVTADLNAKPQMTVEEIRERMSGNICRCGAYSNIIDAIKEVGGVKA